MAIPHSHFGAMTGLEGHEDCEKLQDPSPLLYYRCVKDFVCDDDGILNKILPDGFSPPFSDFCGFQRCYEWITNDEQCPVTGPCQRYCEVENSPFYSTTCMDPQCEMADPLDQYAACNEAGTEVHSAWYQCMVNVFCEGGQQKSNLAAELISKVPFKEFCGYGTCMEEYSNETLLITDTENDCYKYRCMNGTQFYYPRHWCGFRPLDPNKLILPVFLIVALVTIIAIMGIMSCKERSQKIKYLKSQNSYGKLQEDGEANNKH